MVKSSETSFVGYTQCLLFIAQWSIYRKNFSDFEVDCKMMLMLFVHLIKLSGVFLIDKFEQFKIVNWKLQKSHWSKSLKKTWPQKDKL